MTFSQLITEQLCNEYHLHDALAHLQHQFPNRVQYWLLALIEENRMDADQLYEQLCARTRCAHHNLSHQVTHLPGELKVHHLLDFHVILTSQLAGTLQVGLLDPSDQFLIRELSELSQQTIEPLIVHPHWLKEQLAQLEHDTSQSNTNSLAITKKDAPLTDLLCQLIIRACGDDVSDLHIEPNGFHRGYRVRARIDGLLHHYDHISEAQAPRVISWLKMNANLDIAQKRLPQDGRLILPHHALTHLDIRLSTLPTINGEKIVLRLLGSEQHHLRLTQLGLSESQLISLYQTLSQPQGLIIVTGPTGSGKTRTLYAALDYLNHPQLNIASVEDPVEIELAGINQVAVHPAANLTYERLLKALLRQDPDVLMIGEIRDHITLAMAWQSAQTGHLVLTTLHTNSAFETIERLHQLGLSYFQIGEAVQLVMAQRLVRRLCPRCKHQNPDGTWQPQGCDFCHDGFLGRIGIFELLPFTARLRHALFTSNDHISLEQLKATGAIQSLNEQAQTLVKQGITSAQEIERVLGK